MGNCEHEDCKGGACPECGLPVDKYGNTEDDFQFCSFPDCGCDGARLCMAGVASERATTQNVEGMWSGKTLEQKRAAISLMGDVSREDKA